MSNEKASVPFKNFLDMLNEMREEELSKYNPFPDPTTAPDYPACRIKSFLEKNTSETLEKDGFRVSFEFKDGRINMLLHISEEVALDQLKSYIPWLRFWQTRLKEYQGSLKLTDDILEMRRNGKTPAEIADVLNERLEDYLSMYVLENFISNKKLSETEKNPYFSWGEGYQDTWLKRTMAIFFAVGISQKRAKGLCEQAIEKLDPKLEEGLLTMAWSPWEKRLKKKRKLLKPFQGPITAKLVRDKLRQLGI